MRKICFSDKGIVNRRFHASWNRFVSISFFLQPVKAVITANAIIRIVDLFFIIDILVSYFSLIRNTDAAPRTSSTPATTSMPACTCAHIYLRRRPPQRAATICGIQIVQLKRPR